MLNARAPAPATSADGRDLPQVAVIGEALVDRFSCGHRAGGAPFNIARTLAAFGVGATMISRVGADDAEADCVMHSAERFGLSLDGLQRDARRPTGVAEVRERGLDHDFHVHGGAAWEAIEFEPAQALLQAHAPAVLCLGTLAQRGEASGETVRRLLRETTALRFLDVNLRPGADNRPAAQTALALADWVKCNEQELASLLIWFAPQADPAAPAGSPQRALGVRRLLDRFGIERLIVTRGAQGYEAWDRRGRCVARGDGVPVRAPRDTVGAGDAFSAALIALHLAGRRWSEALAGANRYAAAVCAERGPVPDDDDFFPAWRFALGFQAPRQRRRPMPLAH